MPYTIDLSGRVALVTGASSGLGWQFARVLARAGAGVALAGRRVERLKELRAMIEAEGGDAHVVRLDVTDPVSIAGAIAHVETEVGNIDILVNNAGVLVQKKLLDTTEDDFDDLFETNVRGSFFVAQAAARRMVARSQGAAPGTWAGGRIVNIASAAAHRAVSGLGAYAMSKAAVAQMTRCMALEWGRYGINVNAICPGYIDTEMNADAWRSEAGQRLIASLPRRRLGRPDDLDAALMMLVSDASGLVNGALIDVDDGVSL